MNQSPRKPGIVDIEKVVIEKSGKSRGNRNHFFGVSIMAN